jgi:ABC-type multidrug transport system ATPase subunit
MFAANLRLPESITPAEKERRVEHLMDRLGITSIRNSRIGGEKRGISGGEMRRVSIGVELIAAPEVLILDEPTSGKYVVSACANAQLAIFLGLDSVSASKVANVLHSIAHDPENPTAVIASIHQPRLVSISLKTCD